MAACDACGSTILFGGKKLSGLEFCNAKCVSKGTLVLAARQLPVDAVQQETRTIFHGRCPKCQGAGPVDVHTSHRVWSALIMTRWSSQPTISCRPCGIRRQMTDAVFSLVLGWWGIPWGLVLTPVQISRNIAGAFSGRREQPSQKLERIVSLSMAARALQATGASA